MSRRAPMVGLGTGRCGTMSLATIVNGCDKADVTFEKYACPWYAECPKNILLLVEKLDKLADAGILAGEVGGYLLPHLEIIRNAIPDLKIVWMERPIKNTVESFMRWCVGESRLRPQDKVRLGNQPQKIAPLPMIDAATPEQSWQFYCEMYHRHFEMVSPAAWLMQMEMLNNDACLNDLFGYLDIPEEDRVLPEQRQHNSFIEVANAVS